ncbi:hypothetical protein BDY21DRAFT_119453 [Lineolata rhizophorae]|uniref:PD-(D/E)XK nuclease-like domain-containing protein n=1 Tax=Lineolata rhizophorae TaxID=578093 RepID=A0A6A6NQG0_9PEZI|nr:hypothetical protein BDY21DRAFT_119453 [Lineolata rhizophorae]
MKKISKGVGVLSVDLEDDVKRVFPYFVTTQFTFAPAADCEASWNGRVQDRVLDYTLDNDICDKTDFKNCTTATIDPGLPTQSKMVGFAVYLHIASVDFALTCQRLEAVAPNETFSLNHTCPQSLRFRPIAVSIKTRLPGHELDTAALRATVYPVAHLNGLEDRCALSAKVIRCKGRCSRRLSWCRDTPGVFWAPFGPTTILYVFSVFLTISFR